MSNPGSNMSSAVDAEIAEFRAIQESMGKLRSDQQVLMQQHTENEMVKEELDRLNGDSCVYKKVGPVLMKHDLDEAKQTVSKRLEFIANELEKVSDKISAKERLAESSARKIQEMQKAMQAAAAEAVQQIKANG